MELSEKISTYRKNANMTQEEFATRLGVTPQAVSRWERGNGLPDITMLSAICKILKVSADSLLDIHVSPISENDDLAMENEIKKNLIAEPMRIEFGYGLIPYFQEGLETDYLNQCRKNLAKNAGLLLPVLRMMDSKELCDYEVCIFLYDKVLLKKTYDDLKEKTYFQIIDDVADECQKHYGEVLNKQIVKCMLDNLREQYPGVVDDLIPDKISYYKAMLHFRNHLEKKGNLRDLIHIVEKLEDNLSGKQ